MLKIDSTIEEIQKASIPELLTLALEIARAQDSDESHLIYIIIMAMSKITNDVIEIKSKLFMPRWKAETNPDGTAKFLLEDV